MAVAEQIPPPPVRAKPLRNGRWAGFLHVLDVRMKEMRREPEVIFWVFGFPILLALGLGIAFRNKPAERASVAIVGPHAQETLALINRQPRHDGILAQIVDVPQAK